MAHVSTTTGPIAHGVLAEKRDGEIVLEIHHTDYRLYLQVETGTLDGVALHQPIAGRILARAKRVDVVTTGGRYIEPVYGRPRRLQGRISAIDPAANTLTLQTACPFVCTLMPGQKAEGFAVGQLVSFDVERGAVFEPESSK